MVRRIALFTLSLALMAGCGNRGMYSSREEGMQEKVTTTSQEVGNQTAIPGYSVESSQEKPLLEALPKDGQYLIVSGGILGKVSEKLNGRSIRIDAILVWLSPGVEAGMSTFETRDGSVEFEVSWKALDSWEDAEEIMSIKEHIYENYYDSKFRLYGRWEHEDSLMRIYRVLNIDKWKIVEW